MTSLVVKEFRQRTGIPVTVVSGGTGELLSRLRAEASAPRADVLWGGGVESLDADRSLFQPYVSESGDAIPAGFKDPAGYWTGFSVIPMVILYNGRLVPRSEAPRGWSDLTRPLFRGRIAFADPEKSGSAYTALIAMLTAMSASPPGTDIPAGGAGSLLGDAAAWDFLRALMPSLEEGILPQSESVYAGVAAGEWFAGISFETAALALMRTGSDLALVYPAEGTAALPDGVALVADAPNGEDGRRFIDFVLSRDVQRVVSERWSRRSVRQDVPPPASAPALGDLNLLPYDRAAAARAKPAVLAEWSRIRDRP